MPKFSKKVHAKRLCLIVLAIVLDFTLHADYNDKHLFDLTCTGARWIGGDTMKLIGMQVRLLPLLVEAMKIQLLF